MNNRQVIQALDDDEFIKAIRSLCDVYMKNKFYELSDGDYYEGMYKYLYDDNYCMVEKIENGEFFYKENFQLPDEKSNKIIPFKRKNRGD